MKTDAVIDDPESQQVILGCSAVCQQEGPFSAVLSAPALKETDHNSLVYILLMHMSRSSTGRRGLGGQGVPGSEQRTDQRGSEAS